jgi:UDP-N-acetylglucosamine 2-epimerase
MKIVTLIGARPQFIKYGPVMQAIAKYNNEHPEKPIQEVLIHSGQHYDEEMSGIFFEGLGLKKPDYYLGVEALIHHGEQTAEILKRVEAVLLKEKPDAVIVFGDTNTTLAGALAASKLHIPVAHVEAGVRNYNQAQPEEVNRVVVDHISKWLFCVNEIEAENLKKEGITKNVFVVGDVMYDSILLHQKLTQNAAILSKLGVEPKKYVLATAHRQENVDHPERLGSIMRAFAKISGNGFPVVLPLHPRTEKRLKEFNIQAGGVILIEPLAYHEILPLESNAKVIVTDSGGVQREAYWLKVPCVTLLEEEIWPETHKGGWNILVGADEKKIIGAVLGAKPGKGEPSGFGDGHAAEKIIQVLTSIA